MGIPSTVSIGAFLLFMYYPYLLGSTVRIGIEALTFIVKKLCNYIQNEYHAQEIKRERPSIEI